VSASTENEHIENNTRLDRYEITIDGQVLGFAAYRPRRDGAIVFTHTEIDEAYEGHGLGGKLARAALEDVRASGGSVVPDCPFIEGYIDRHPEFRDLVR